MFTHGLIPLPLHMVAVFLYHIAHTYTTVGHFLLGL